MSQPPATIEEFPMISVSHVTPPSLTMTVNRYSCMSTGPDRCASLPKERCWKSACPQSIFGWLPRILWS